MPQVAAATSTQNALGFLGRLYQFGKRYNTLTRLIGGLGNSESGDIIIVGPSWRRVFQHEFPTNVDWDLPAPAQPARLEGANAPQANTFQPSQAKNVIQIFHEAVEATYLAQSEIGRLTSTGVLDSQESPNNYFGKFRTQLNMALAKIANDFNYSGWNGTYANPANPTASALGMRGLIPGITTNALANGGTPRALTKQLLADLYKEMIDNAGVQPSQGLLLACNTFQLSVISTLYETQFNNGQDRMIAGVMVRTIYTPFGVLNIILDTDIPQGVVVFLNPDVISGAYLPMINEDSGAPEPALFFEQLAKTGSKSHGQIYGQLGLDAGPEWGHGKITDLTTS